jgi:holin-like protein
MLGTLTWLLLFQLVGEVTVRWLKLPLPGSVVGMVLLFAVLVLRGGVPEHLRAASHTLLQHLMLLLVPATTAVMLHAAVTMAITALTLRLLLTGSKGRLR